MPCQPMWYQLRSHYKLTSLFKLSLELRLTWDSHGALTLIVQTYEQQMRSPWSLLKPEVLQYRIHDIWCAVCSEYKG